MNNQNNLKEEVKRYIAECGYDGLDTEMEVEDIARHFAKWKEEQMIEKAVDRGYLTDWYQSSVDETQEPIWTDKHLDELYGDFYLIPKK